MQSNNGIKKRVLHFYLQAHFYEEETDKVMTFINKIVIETENTIMTANEAEGKFCCRDIIVEMREDEGGIKCYVTAQETPVSYVQLYFKKEFSDNALLLGDAWERSYGELGWQKQPYSGIMPWYFFAKDNAKTYAYGVKVRPSAMCAWQVEKDEICLILDVCNGTKGVKLNGRRLLAAEIVSSEYNTDVFSACKAFCKVMCNDGIFPKKPVYGGNNWYYAYGASSQEEIVRDAEVVAKLSEGLENRPFMVVDAGWEKNTLAGPWNELKASYKDMAQLAQDIRALNVRPGCWIRPLYYVGVEFPESWVLRHMRFAEQEGVVLDVTVKDAREYVMKNICAVKEWGYELLKHDFSTMDFFGGYAFEFEDFMTRKKEAWSFFDQTCTNAEIIVEFYQDIRKAAEGLIILGCNTLSHLSAGLVEIQRIGDDTSGVEWNRTKKMGINTLAFRLCQHNAFYAVDADCVGITKNIDWQQNVQWLELVANSGTPLFFSLSPDSYTDEIFEALRSAMVINAKQADVCEPVSWLETKTPEKWKINGEMKEFRW